MGNNRALTPILFALAALPVRADDIEIQRSVIQRDQQSAEFAARIRGEDTTRLEQLHARQLSEVYRPPLNPDAELARQLQTWQRQKMADERMIVLPPPALTLSKPPEKPKPLPLPGGPGERIELVAPQRPAN